MSAQSPSADSSQAAGMVIVRLRRRARLTGQQLGQLVRMSQAKISRIETGQTRLTPTDAGKLARALGASAEETEQLLVLAQRARNEMTDWRHSPQVVGQIQIEAAALEAQAGIIRIFQPNVVVGLAQTAEYARAIISSIDEVYETPRGGPDSATVARALTARIRRQELLIRPDREFHFLMGEAALSGRLITPNQMLSQIDRLRQLAEQPNVGLRFIPADTRLKLSLPLLHGFELLDDTAVFVDNFNTTMISRGADDLAKFRLVFDRLNSSAEADPGPMLDKYEQIYKTTSDRPSPS